MRRSVAVRHLDPHGIADDRDRIRIDRHDARSTDGNARAYVKAATVKRTDNSVVFHLAHRQQCTTVRTDVIDRVESIFKMIDPNWIPPVEVDTFTRTWRHIGRFADFNPGHGAGILPQCQAPE